MVHTDVLNTLALVMPLVATYLTPVGIEAIASTSNSSSLRKVCFSDHIWRRQLAPYIIKEPDNTNSIITIYSKAVKPAIRNSVTSRETLYLIQKSIKNVCQSPESLCTLASEYLRFDKLRCLVPAEYCMIGAQLKSEKFEDQYTRGVLAFYYGSYYEKFHRDYDTAASWYKVSMKVAPTFVPAFASYGTIQLCNKVKFAAPSSNAVIPNVMCSEDFYNFTKTFGIKKCNIANFQSGKSVFRKALVLVLCSTTLRRLRCRYPAESLARLYMGYTYWLSREGKDKEAKIALQGAIRSCRGQFQYLSLELLCVHVLLLQRRSPPSARLYIGSLYRFCILVEKRRRTRSVLPYLLYAHFLEFDCKRPIDAECYWKVVKESSHRLYTEFYSKDKRIVIKLVMIQGNGGLSAIESGGNDNDSTFNCTAVLSSNNK